MWERVLGPAGVASEAGNDGTTSASVLAMRWHSWFSRITSRSDSFAGDPIVKIPEGTTTISGQVGQSRKLSFVLRQRFSPPTCTSMGGDNLEAICDRSLRRNEWRIRGLCCGHWTYFQWGMRSPEARRWKERLSTCPGAHPASRKTIGTL
jgi:hypothetical protein